MSAFTDLPPDELEHRLTGQRIALDCETAPRPEYAHLKDAALRWHQNQVIGIGLSCKVQGVRAYVTLCSQDDEGKWVYDPARAERVTKFLWRLVECPEVELLFHNARFDLHALGLDPNDRRFHASIHDTSLMIHLLDSRERKALEIAEQRWLGTNRKTMHLKPHHGKRKKVHEWPFEQTAAYCTDDAVITEELFYTLAPKIGKAGLLRLYQKEIKYMRLLWTIERRGVRVDMEALESQRNELATREAELEQQLYAECGQTFNWRAPKQLSHAVYEGLGIAKPSDPNPNHRHTMSKYYTDSCTSSKLLVEKVQHPVGGTVLALREAAKLRQTLDGWRDLVDDEPALHTSFNQTNSSPDALGGGTRTGRLSSTAPNLQNLTNVTRRSHVQAALGDEAMVRTGAYRLRNVLVSRPGYTFVVWDFEQQEARLFALLSGEERMIALLANKGDMHADVGELVWGSRDPVHRRWAKDLNFALIYGMNEASLAEMLALPLAHAHAIAEQYFRTFPRIKPYMTETMRELKAHGVIRMWDGRLWKPNTEQETYKGVNAEVQGGAAGLLSIAALRVAQWLAEREAGYIVLLCHDEIVAEVPDDLVATVAPAIAKVMEIEDIFGIPFPVSPKYGKSYGSLEKCLAN